MLTQWLLRNVAGLFALHKAANKTQQWHAALLETPATAKNYVFCLFSR
jgi:hypothetical protein